MSALAHSEQPERPHRGRRRQGHSPASRIATASAAATFLLLLSCTIPAASASREMLLTQPMPGDALVLAQPSYEWGRRGPATLRSLHRYAKTRIDNRILAAGGKDGEADKGVGGSGLSWDQVASLPPEEPFPMGRSEQRLINYGTLIYHRMTHPQQPHPAQDKDDHKVHTAPGHRAAEDGKAGEQGEQDAARQPTSQDKATAQEAIASDETESEVAEDAHRLPGRSARRAQQAKARLEALEGP